MSSKYEDMIKNARINADCGEHMSPEEVTTLLNVVETTFAELAAENAGLKEYRPQPSGAAMMEALDAFYEYHEDIPEQGMMAAFEILCCKRPVIPATDAFLAEVRAQDLNAFIRHHSAELDAPIKNGGEQLDEKSVRIRDIIVSARLFREQIRKEAAQ